MKSSRFWVTAFWFYLGILLAISMSAYLKIIPTEIAQVPYYDTILHFLLLGIAAYLSHLALNKRQLHILNTALPLAPVIVFLFCIIDEIIQKYTPHRSADIIDLAADICGIILFTWLAEKTPIRRVSNIK
ncbi:VanZ family protein [Calothrix sp. UHCC 0171]|uniref:VanZ family protein n=1 Tax=Calothrix sp. UHCC 0171 TaxID=3110245 RepID=UPI002B220949|nr:VanZ family protein [Calothrix sp. UHCC 0171]MEA5570949.1 VanZ family protein [Calothrix sp. UHCC 0171]